MRWGTKGEHGTDRGRLKTIVDKLTWDPDQLNWDYSNNSIEVETSSVSALASIFLLILDNIAAFICIGEQFFSSDEMYR